MTDSPITELARAVVRNHDGICVGIFVADAPYCSAAPHGHPLCKFCEELAVSIAAALSAVRAQDAPYMQHKGDCVAFLCQYCQHARWLHSYEEDIDEETCLVQGMTFTARTDCTCGLDALRAIDNAD